MTAGTRPSSPQNSAASAAPQQPQENSDALAKKVVPQPLPAQPPQPATASDKTRGSERTGQVLLAVLLVLAVVATIIMMVTDNQIWLRIATLSALWAAFVGVLLTSLYKRKSTKNEVEARTLKQVYDLEIQREVDARLAHEMMLEKRALQRKTDSDNDAIAALRDELVMLRQHLSAITGTEIPDTAVAVTSRRLGELVDKEVPALDESGSGTTPVWGKKPVTAASAPLGKIVASTGKAQGSPAVTAAAAGGAATASTFRDRRTTAAQQREPSVTPPQSTAPAGGKTAPSVTPTPQADTQSAATAAQRASSKVKKAAQQAQTTVKNVTASTDKPQAGSSRAGSAAKKVESVGKKAQQTAKKAAAAPASPKAASKDSVKETSENKAAAHNSAARAKTDKASENKDSQSQQTKPAPVAAPAGQPAVKKKSSPVSSKPALGTPGNTAPSAAPTAGGKPDGGVHEQGVPFSELAARLAKNRAEHIDRADSSQQAAARDAGNAPTATPIPSAAPASRRSRSAEGGSSVADLMKRLEQERGKEK